MNDKMTDAELSKILGRYQAAESIGIFLGALCVIAGCVLAFVLHELIVVLILGFSGVVLLLLIALPAQKKKNALIWQQLGGYFGAELKRFFGEEPEKPELPIDYRFLKNVGLIGIKWTECRVKDFHEGEHSGLRFSAANVELGRTVEERSGPDNDNWMTRSETLFRGVVLRCKDICAPDIDIALNEQFHERKGADLTDPAVFRRHFAARTADGQPADEMVTPQLRALVRRLEEFANNGKVGGLILRGGELTLALNTGYVFANVPNAIDMRDIDGIRKWFTASLTGMAGLLDILRKSPALTDTVSRA